MSDRLSIFTLCNLVCALAIVAAGPGCASMPEPNFKKFTFPKNAFVGDVQRPYTVLGPVRSEVNYQTIDFAREESDLCHNYYNKAVRDLVKYAKRQGGDAVVDVKSVVFLVDGRTETYATPECSDDGGDGQILAQGIAVKWKGAEVEAGAWTRPAPRTPTATALVTPAAVPPAKAAHLLAAPSAANPNAPVFPEGGTLVPELDEETPAGAYAQPAALAAQPATAPARDTPNTAAIDNSSDNAPVTARMEPYDPPKGLMSSPNTSGTTHTPIGLGGTSTMTFPRQPAAEQAPAAPAIRYAPGDPRFVPGSIQRTTPP